MSGDGGICLRQSVNRMTHRDGLKKTGVSFGYHFDSGPSVTVVFVLVDNGSLEKDFDLSMNKALLNYTIRPCGTVKVCHVLIMHSILC